MCPCASFAVKAMMPPVENANFKPPKQNLSEHHNLVHSGLCIAKTFKITSQSVSGRPGGLFNREINVIELILVFVMKHTRAES